MFSPISSDRRAQIVLVIFLLLAAALYLSTLDNGLRTADLEGGDLITHQYAQVQARPSNAPGYPLYTMGGWLWFHGWRLLLPTANPIPILSSYSTLWALLALGLFFSLLYRISQRNLLITLALSSFYAITYFFWFYSVTTEQYTSAVLHTLAIAALVHAWDEDPQDRYLYALAFLFGLALAHMVTVLFIAPGALLFILKKRPALLRRFRLILQALGLSLIPLLSYIYVYIRGAQHPEWRGVGEWPNAWAWFVSFLATKQGQDELTWVLGPFTAEFPRLIWVEITPFLLILGLLGWWLLGRRYALFYGLTALIYFVFCYIDRFGNWYQVIMPLYPLLLLGAGVTLNRLWKLYPRRLWRIALILLLCALLLSKFAHSYPRANQHNRPDDSGLLPGQAILADDPPLDAAIVTTLEEKLALDYLTQIWGQRPDVQAISTAQIAQVLAENRPLLVTEAAASYAAAESGIDLRYNAWGATLLLASPKRLPPPHLDSFQPRERILGDGLRLVGLRITPGEKEGVWNVAIALEAMESPQHDWSLSVRLLDAGKEVAQKDHPAPALGHTPTTTLRPGDIIVDAFRFEIAPAPSPQGIRLILYRQLEDGTFQNLAVIEEPLAQP
ncbi:MAG: DUF2723 domain-containing protein [Chloroflexi bacterium]|nr:DUF2723 domain-containing protein [Chloroflexota bacterium]